MSACLGGRASRYDGSSRGIPLVRELIDCGTAFPICPEVEGGLTTPRPACEIVGGTGVDVLQGQARVINKDGVDVSAEFRKGAEESLKMAKEVGATAAILCERSPSCGVKMIHDGTFCGRLQPGMGVTGAVLALAGIEPISSDDPDLRERVLACRQGDGSSVPGQCH